MKDFIKEREREFKEMKQFCHFTLKGDNKYYNAYQCKDMKNHIEQKGFEQYKAEDIEEVYFTSNQYYGSKIVISLNSGGEASKSFNSLKEMLFFIQGYNNALHFN